VVRLVAVVLILFAVAYVYLDGLMAKRSKELGEQPRVNVIERAKSVEPLVLQHPQELEKQLQRMEGR